ncbi:hypothetical protein ACH4C6_34355 [Streptomyces sp. NPDC017943]|uniref:hypothetical protein n=1 Tax=Streptomyces sp. NPDC017943 TaxID=3365019 RepID=UPI00379C69C5
MPTTLTEQEIALLRQVMIKNGIYHNVYELEADDPVHRLAEEGYLTQVPYSDDSHESQRDYLVSNKAVGEYPDFLENGLFGEKGGNYNDPGNGPLGSEHLKALEESFAQVPAYEWNPAPREGEGFHVSHLVASVRTLETSLEGKWFPAVHDAVQEIRHKLSSTLAAGVTPDLDGALNALDNDTIKGNKGKRAGRNEFRYRLLALRGAHENLGLVQDLVLYIHDMMGSRDLPERSQLLTANSACFGALVSMFGYSWAQKDIPEWNGYISRWSPEIAASHADSASRARDVARWKFHNLHAILGAHNKEAYFFNNPFKVDHIDSVPVNENDILSPRLLLNLSEASYQCAKASFDYWIAVRQGEPQVPITWSASQVETLTIELNEAFSELPLEEQSVVREWHEKFEESEHLWNKAWTPINSISQAAQGVFSRKGIRLPPPSEAYAAYMENYYKANTGIHAQLGAHPVAAASDSPQSQHAGALAHRAEPDWAASVYPYQSGGTAGPSQPMAAPGAYPADDASGQPTYAPGPSAPQHGTPAPGPNRYAGYSSLKLAAGPYLNEAEPSPRKEATTAQAASIQAVAGPPHPQPAQQQAETNRKARTSTNTNQPTR